MSFCEGALLAIGGNSGNTIYDVSPIPRNGTLVDTDLVGLAVLHRARAEPVDWLARLEVVQRA